MLEKRVEVLIVIFFALVFLLILLGVYIVADIERYKNENLSDLVEVGQQSLWAVKSVEPEGDSALVKITVVGSDEEERVFGGVSSYGISPGNEYLFIVKSEKAQVINLRTLEEKLLDLGEIGLDKILKGEILGWKEDVSRFVLPAVLDNGSGSLIIFSKSAELITKIDLPVEYRITFNQDEFSLTYPIKYSSDGLLALRVYSAGDALEDNYQNLTQLPVYLSVYNEMGELVENLLVRDFDENASDVYYDFDRNRQRVLKYVVTTDSGQINLDNELIYTKIAL